MPEGATVADVTVGARVCCVALSRCRRVIDRTFASVPASYNNKKKLDLRNICN